MDSGCTDIYQQRTCQEFGRADSFTQNPERITRTVNAGQQFNVWVLNESLATSANYTLNVRIDYASVEAGQTTGADNTVITFGGTASGRLKK
jgi:hypothetical protein